MFARNGIDVTLVCIELHRLDFRLSVLPLRVVKGNYFLIYTKTSKHFAKPN